MEYIDSLDKKLFFIINNDWGHTYLDMPMLFISNRLTWVCLFAIAFAIACYLRRWRFIWVCGLIAIGLMITDVGVYYGLKPFFGRLRPCKEFPDMVRIVRGCAGKLGLPSNHAANGMVVAMLLFLMKLPIWGTVALAAVFLVGFSRVYLGMHYPTDIFVGYVAGAAVAVLVYAVTKPFHRIFKIN